MLVNMLQSTNQLLDNLIEITSKDIDDIKKANHQALFERNYQKEELVKRFVELKNGIDSTLAERNRNGMPLINPNEEPLLDEFKEKLQKFYTLHKKFAKMAFTVTHFYNNLVHKVTDSQPDIGYGMSPTMNHHNNFSLKG